MHLSDLISCRMYANGKAALEGFTKNYFAVFDFAVLPFIFVYLYLLLLAWLPIIVLCAKALGAAPDASYAYLALCMGLSVLIWLLPFLEARIPSWLELLYPLLNAASTLTAFRSMVMSLSGRLSWKGRPLAKQRWKWF